MAAWIILAGVVTIFLVFIYDLLGNHNLVIEAIGKFVATIGTLVGVGAVVVAWVYRTASVRLGVVDLFASEITTLEQGLRRTIAPRTPTKSCDDESVKCRGSSRLALPSAF